MAQVCILSLPTVYNIFAAASDGSDYRGESVDLFFIGTMQCIVVNIIDDSILEENETFTVTLNTSSSVLLGTQLTTVTITDNDSM